MEIKLLKLAVERLYDQVEELSLELKSVQEELKELRERKLVAPAAEVQSNIKDEYINTKEVQQLLGRLLQHVTQCSRRRAFKAGPDQSTTG